MQWSCSVPKNRLKFEGRKDKWCVSIYADDCENSIGSSFRVFDSSIAFECVYCSNACDDWNDLQIAQIRRFFVQNFDKGKVTTIDHQPIDNQSRLSAKLFSSFSSEIVKCNPLFDGHSRVQSVSLFFLTRVQNAIQLKTYWWIDYALCKTWNQVIIGSSIKLLKLSSHDSSSSSSPNQHDYFA